jgi:hypothetical protein
MSVNTLIADLTDFNFPNVIFIGKEFDMLRQDTYIKASEEFGTAVGMARGVEIWDAQSHKLTDDMRCNELIYGTIEEGTYQKVRREVLRLEKIARKGIKELTIYKKAIKGDSRTTTKSAKVF